MRESFLAKYCDFCSVCLVHLISVFDKILYCITDKCLNFLLILKSALFTNLLANFAKELILPRFLDDTS